jgi:hypothetical protein
VRQGTPERDLVSFVLSHSRKRLVDHRLWQLGFPTSHTIHLRDVFYPGPTLKITSEASLTGLAPWKRDARGAVLRKRTVRIWLSCRQKGQPGP